MKPLVQVVVTGKQIGTGPIVPFSHADGPQFYVKDGVRTYRPVFYLVALYEVQITGGGKYPAIRFGLRNNGKVLPHRGCDAGLSHARTCTPTWNPRYSPHSFNGVSRPGAWQLLPGEGFLIHEGADTRDHQVGGSIGCVEILDGNWNRFLDEIEKIAGISCADIGARRAMKVTIEHAGYPTATLRT